MSTPGQRRFARIDRLPPYVFNITAELKMAARRRGEDIIDMSMGNPARTQERKIPLFNHLRTLMHRTPQKYLGGAGNETLIPARSP